MKETPWLAQKLDLKTSHKKKKPTFYSLTPAKSKMRHASESNKDEWRPEFLSVNLGFLGWFRMVLPNSHSPGGGWAGDKFRKIGWFRSLQRTRWILSCEAQDWVLEKYLPKERQIVSRNEPTSLKSKTPLIHSPYHSQSSLPTAILDHIILKTFIFLSQSPKK